MMATPSFLVVATVLPFTLSVYLSSVSAGLPAMVAMAPCTHMVILAVLVRTLAIIQPKAWPLSCTLPPSCLSLYAAIMCERHPQKMKEMWALHNLHAARPHSRGVCSAPQPGTTRGAGKRGAHRAKVKASRRSAANS